MELNGTDFLININDLNADLFINNIYNAEVEFSIDLPLVEMMNFVVFLELAVTEDCDDKEFEIVVHDLSPSAGAELKLEGSGLSWLVPAAILDSTFTLELKMWCRLTNADIVNISELQKKTGVDIDDNLSVDEINAIWEKKWEIAVKDVKLS